MQISHCDGWEPIGNFQPGMVILLLLQAFSVNMRAILGPARNNVILF
jgi:hypothetical protein